MVGEYVNKYKTQIQHVDPDYLTYTYDLVAYFQQRFKEKLLSFREKVIAQVPILYTQLDLHDKLEFLDVKLLQGRFYDSYYRTVVYFDASATSTYKEDTVRQYLANKYFKPDRQSAYKSFLLGSGLMNPGQEKDDYYVSGYYKRMYNVFHEPLPNVAFSATLWFQSKRLNVLTVTPLQLLLDDDADYVHFANLSNAKRNKKLQNALDNIFRKITRCKQALQLQRVVLPVFGINKVEEDDKMNYTQAWVQAFTKFSKPYHVANINVLVTDTDLLKRLKTFAPEMAMCFRDGNGAGDIVLAQTQLVLDKTLFVDECTPDLLPGTAGVDDFYQLSSSNLAISTSLMLNPFMTLSGVECG